MIELILICMGMCNVHGLMNDQDSTWMSLVSGLRKELLPSLPKAQPTQSLRESPAPCLLVSWSELAPLSWKNLIYPLRSLGNWSHPLPLVSAWLAVDYSQRAAATLSSLDQLSAAWWSATGCALLLIQPTKIAQKLTVSLDFRSTAGCEVTHSRRSGRGHGRCVIIILLKLFFFKNPDLVHRRTSAPVAAGNRH